MHSSSNLLTTVPLMLGLSISLSLTFMLLSTDPSRGTTLHAPPLSSSFGSSKTVSASTRENSLPEEQEQSKLGSYNDQSQKPLRSNRFLVNINIMGSAGPTRFVVSEKELVSGAIDTALKSYAREERLPLLGFDASNFLLYCANAGFDALSPLEPIGSFGVRNFVLCKKHVYSSSKTAPQSELVSQKSRGVWKAWLNKSFGLK